MIYKAALEVILRGSLLADHPTQTTWQLSSHTFSGDYHHGVDLLTYWNHPQSVSS